jgi:hypothetical protein
MDKDFEMLISRFLLQQGKEILDESTRCKATLKDYVKGYFKKDMNLFLQALDAKVHVKITRANDIELSAKQIIQQLQDEYSLSADAAYDITAFMCRMLRNYDLPIFATTINKINRRNTMSNNGDEREFVYEGTEYIARRLGGGRWEIVLKKTGERPSSMKAIARGYLKQHCNIDIPTNDRVVTSTAIKMLFEKLRGNV